MGRRPLPDRVLIKLPAGTLAEISARLPAGRKRADFIRDAIAAAVVRLPPCPLDCCALLPSATGTARQADEDRH